NFVHPKLSTHDEEAKDEESFDPIVQTPSHMENSDDEGNDDESHGMNVGGDEIPDAKDDDEDLYGDVNINLEGRDVQMTDVYTTHVLEYTHVTLTPLKKILIKKLESNKFIHRSNEQRNLFKTMVDVYECDKIILDTYGDTVMLKRRHDDEDKDEEPSTRSDRGSKRRLAGKEPESTSAPKEKASLLKGPNLIKRLVDTLTPELQVGPTYELMKGSCKSLPLPLIPNSRGCRVIPFDHFINSDLEYLRGGAFILKYTTSVTKTKAVDYGYINWIEDLVPRTMWSQAPVSYDKYDVTPLKWDRVEYDVSGALLHNITEEDTRE
nr:hypothetical protein [Tanacetum cinerariifolium]